MFREVNERGFDLRLASVTKEGGVEFRDDLEIAVWNPGGDTSSYKRVQPGDFVIGLRSFQSGLGYSTLEGLVSPAYTVLRPLVHIEHRFYKHLFKSRILISLLDNVSSGIRQGRTISAWDFGEMLLPVPPANEQLRIANYLDAETARIDALIEKKNRLLGVLRERFREETRSDLTGGQRFRDPLNPRPDEITLPEWMVLKLPWDLSFGSGTTPSSGDSRFYGGDIPWLVTANLRDEQITGDVATLTQDALSTFSVLRLYSAPSLVVAMYGATVGRLGMTTFPTTVNQACCVIQGGARTSLWFLFYWLLVHRGVLLESSVGAGQPNISQEILRSIRIAIPDLAEQERLVVRVREHQRRLRELESRLRAQIALLHEHRQALITAAVTGQLELAEAA